MNLKSKTISGFKWSFIDTVSKYFLLFFVSIILARLLSPSDYGLIGIVGVFLGFSRVFIDGGFSDALIRKVNCTIEDYSSVFMFNMFLATFFYLLLFFTAPLISIFFKHPQLTNLIRMSSLGLIINASSSVHSVILKKSINFRLLAIISFFSTILSGLVSLIMAYRGYGVWSLVWSGLIQSALSSILLWLLNKSSIKFFFNVKILKEHFNFGLKIMLGSLINSIYNNVYYILIGKIYNPSLLGFYTRADNFQKLFSDNIDIIVRQVTYPVLSNIQDSKDVLKETYRTLIKYTAFVTFIILLGLFVISKCFIILLIGEKWLPSVHYLQILCFVGLLMPLISININVLNVKGRSDLSLKIVLLKVILIIPTLFIGYFYGINVMLISTIFSMCLLYYIVMFFSNLILNYSIKEQLKDIFPTFISVFFSYFPSILIGLSNHFSPIMTLILQLIIASIMLIFCFEFFKNKEYLVIKNQVLKIFHSKLKI